jgi:hypothetical protein
MVKQLSWVMGSGRMQQTTTERTLLSSQAQGSPASLRVGGKCQAARWPGERRRPDPTLAEACRDGTLVEQHASSRAKPHLAARQPASNAARELQRAPCASATPVMLRPARSVSNEKLLRQATARELEVEQPSLHLRIEEQWFCCSGRRLRVAGRSVAASSAMIRQ